jgi:AcrR family transcriptional regulator
MATRHAARSRQDAAPRRAAVREGGSAAPGVRALAAQATRDSHPESRHEGVRPPRLCRWPHRADQPGRQVLRPDDLLLLRVSKEGLFIAVIEDTYRRFNEAEQGLVLDTTQPLSALDAMIRFVWTYYQKNPEFITLLNSENLLRGKHIGKSARAKEYSSPALAITDRVLQSGISAGLFRPELNPRDVYLMIASLSYFYLSNRYTLSSFLGENLESPAALAHWEAFVLDAVRRAVCITPIGQAS